MIKYTDFKFFISNIQNILIAIFKTSELEIIESPTKCHQMVAGCQKGAHSYDISSHSHSATKPELQSFLPHDSHKQRSVIT